MDGYPVLPDVPFQCHHDFDHLSVISDLLVGDIIVTSGHKVTKDFSIELPMMEYGAFVTILFKDGKTIFKGSSGFRGGHFGVVVCSKFGGRIRGCCIRRKGKFKRRGNMWVKCVVCSSLSVGVFKRRGNVQVKCIVCSLLSTGAVGHVKSVCGHNEGSARKPAGVSCSDPLEVHKDRGSVRCNFSPKGTWWACKDVK